VSTNEVQYQITKTLDIKFIFSRYLKTFLLFVSTTNEHRLLLAIVIIYHRNFRFKFAAEKLDVKVI
jgi:hypothetical protein